MADNLYDWQVDPIPDGAIEEVAPCPVCNHTHARPTMTVENLNARLVVCQRCQTGRLYPQPSLDEIVGFYPPEYYGVSGRKFESIVEWAVRLVASRRVRFLSSGLPAGARVLDVGCGRGVLLRSLADREFEVHGMECVEAAVEGIDPRVEVRLAPNLLQANYDRDMFDQVILWHVLEHVTEPRELLVEIHRILRPGGRVVVAVPNFSSWQARWAGPTWFHLDLPRHLFHFPVDGVRQMMEASGFECRSHHHFSLRQNPFGWVQSALNRCRAWPRNGLYNLLQRRPATAGALFDRKTRAWFRTAYFAGMPVALVLSILASWLRTGATVHIVGRKEG